jgi:hypothetical protein
MIMNFMFSFFKNIHLKIKKQNLKYNKNDMWKNGRSNWNSYHLKIICKCEIWSNVIFANLKFKLVKIFYNTKDM